MDSTVQKPPELTFHPAITANIPLKGVTTELGRLPSVPLQDLRISEVRRYRYSVALRCVWDYLGHMRVLPACQDARNDLDIIRSPDFRSQ